MSARARTILWLDAAPACVVGLALLAFSHSIAELYGLPRGVLLFVGSANLVYSSYSGTLATLAARGRGLSTRAIELLVAANLGWAVVCVGLIAAHGARARALGLLQLALEGVYVIMLAVAEWRVVRTSARRRPSDDRESVPDARPPR